MSLRLFSLNRDPNAAFDWTIAEAIRSALIVQPTMNCIDKISDYRLVRRLFVELGLQMRILIRRLNRNSDAALDWIAALFVGFSLS